MGVRKWTSGINLPDPTSGVASIASNNQAQVSYTNDSEEDIVVTRWRLVLALAASGGGAIAGAELAKYSHPNAADNTMAQYAQILFYYELASATGKFANGPLNAAGMFNSDGETYLPIPLRIPSKGTLTITIINQAAVAVKGQLVMDGAKVGQGEVWPS